MGRAGFSSHDTSVRKPNKEMTPIQSYRRRDYGRRVKIRKVDLDNRWVVPYNLGLLFRYICHINVEAFSIIKVVKYLFKYV